MGKKTPLYKNHLASHAKIIDFAGWDMPLHYGSQLLEHQCVREDAGIFDVSHMAVIDIAGEGATSYLRFLLANNVDRLIPGKALYTCMLNEQGGIIDDLIVYKREESLYRLVINAGTTEKDLTWMQSCIKNFPATLTKRESVIIATQGPKTVEKITAIFPENVHEIAQLKPFHALSFQEFFVARTGYTGEDGFEWILPKEKAADFWQKLIEKKFSPCGLGARDTLRLEAGLNLYGTDMDETVTPLESNLSWTVAFEPKERNFIGRLALEEQLKTGVKQKLVGLVLEQGIPRHHHKVIVEGIGEGEVTSGSFSPTLKKGIALARVPQGEFDRCVVDIRGKKMIAAVIKPPFLKQKRG